MKFIFRLISRNDYNYMPSCSAGWSDNRRKTRAHSVCCFQSNEPQGWVCMDCKYQHDTYMLKKDVWSKVVPGYTELRRKATKKWLLEGCQRDSFPYLCVCMSCAEKRLGRKLIKKDFLKRLPCNYEIISRFH